MEGSAAAGDDAGRGTRSGGGYGPARRAGALIAATLGSVAGGLLVIPLMVVAPDWLFLTLPQVVGAVFAASMAYLVAGPARTALSRAMSRSLLAAAACALLNLALLAAMVNGRLASGDLLLPGGWATHLLEAAIVGAVAGVVATKGDQARPAMRPVPFLAALLFSAAAIAVLLIVGASVLPVLFAA